MKILILFSLLICSCSPSRLITPSCRDSLYVKTIERKVTIFDTVQIEIPKLVEHSKAKQDSSFLSNDLAKSEAIICPDGTLYHSLETIPQQLSQPTKSEVTVQDSIIYKERLVTKTVKIEKDLSRWQEIQMDGFWLLLAMLSTMILAILFLK